MPKKSNYVERSQKTEGGWITTQYDQGLYLKLYPYEHFQNKTISDGWLPDPQLITEVISEWKIRRTIMSILKFWRAK